jgi:hypothetical protein
VGPVGCGENDGIDVFLPVEHCAEVGPPPRRPTCVGDSLCRGILALFDDVAYGHNLYARHAQHLPQQV